MKAEVLALPSPRRIEQQNDDLTRTGEAENASALQHAPTNEKD